MSSVNDIPKIIHYCWLENIRFRSLRRSVLHHGDVFAQIIKSLNGMRTIII